MSARRQLEFVLRRAGAKDVGGRAGELLDWVELRGYDRRMPATLSGGEAQRLALARALAVGPRLLLLDEPLGALDALTRIEMQRLIERLWREHGFTALLVTHDVGEAVALADRVLVVEDGRIGRDERLRLPRPRSRGDAACAALEERILRRVLRQPEPPAPRPAPGRPAHALRWAL
jgi:sulfonate transport system ATP-binding protein